MDNDSAKVVERAAAIMILGDPEAAATPRTNPRIFTIPSCPPKITSLNLAPARWSLLWASRSAVLALEFT